MGKKNYSNVDGIEKVTINNLEDFSSMLADSIRNKTIDELISDDLSEELASYIRGYVKAPINS